MAAAGARADDPDLAIGGGQGFEERGGPGGVADDLVIGNTTGAADHGGHIFGLAMAGAAVEIRCEGGITLVGELAGRLLVPVVPAGHVVQQDDAGKGPRSDRSGEISVDDVAAVAGDRHGFGEHSLVLIGPSHKAPFLVQERRRPYLPSDAAGTRRAARTRR